MTSPSMENNITPPAMPAQGKKIGVVAITIISIILGLAIGLIIGFVIGVRWKPWSVDPKLATLSSSMQSVSDTKYKFSFAYPSDGLTHLESQKDEEMLKEHTYTVVTDGENFPVAIVRGSEPYEVGETPFDCSGNEMLGTVKLGTVTVKKCHYTDSEPGWSAGYYTNGIAYEFECVGAEKLGVAPDENLCLQILSTFKFTN